MLAASAAVPSAAPVVMNDCMVLGIKLDQRNPPQHMQQPTRAKSSRQENFPASPSLVKMPSEESREVPTRPPSSNPADQ